MIEKLFNSLWTFVRDRGQKISLRLTVVTLFITVAILWMDYSSFFFYYKLSNKTEQLKNITEILQDTTLSASEVRAIKNMRINVINDENVINKTSEFLSKVHLYVPAVSNPVYHFLSSCSIVILAYLVISIMVIKQGQATFKDYILAFTVTTIVCAFLGYMFYFLFSLIPKIGRTWGWNYFVNILLSMLIPNLIIFPFNKDLHIRLRRRSY